MGFNPEIAFEKVFGLAVYALLLLCLMFLPSFASANEPLWAKLKTEPNLIVMMRHAYAGGGQPLVWDESGHCNGELRLTPDGKALARKIGTAFAARGIKPSVISSPMCRCLETARIAFGDVPVLQDPDLRESGSADAERQHAFENKAKTLIANKRGAIPLVFISHRPNIDQLTMELMDEGDLLVGRVSENGEIDVLGKIVLDTAH